MGQILCYEAPLETEQSQKQLTEEDDSSIHVQEEHTSTFPATTTRSTDLTAAESVSSSSSPIPKESVSQIPLEETDPSASTLGNDLAETEETTIPQVDTNTTENQIETNDPVQSRPISGEIRREQSLSSPTEDFKNNSSDQEAFGHARSKSEGIFPAFSFTDAKSLHASWTNAGSQDALGVSLSSNMGFHSSGHASSNFLGEQPLSLSRVGSVDDQADHNGGISSAVHDAARITNWATVKQLCETMPEAACYVGRDRWTALHHACNRRCPYPDVVEALIRAYPDALISEEDKGWLPLHYACRFKAPKDVVRLLLQMDPEKGRTAVTRLDRQGRTPLYYAVRYDAPPGVVGLLLDVDASAVLEEDQNADSPLALVWDAWAEKLDGKRTLQKLFPSDAEDMSQEELATHVQRRLESQKKVFDRWNKANIFLKAAFGFSVDEDAHDSQDRKWRILHATAAIKCHPSLFMLACALHPEQAFEVDNNDLRIPSHICAGSQSASRLTALHLAASSKANGESGRLVVNELIRLNPDATKASDTEGSLPLHRIVENNYKAHWTSDGAKDIYLANPEAITSVDLIDRLPLHRAAQINTSSGSDEGALSRSIVYNLIELNSDGASHSDIYGCYPLHLAAQHGTDWTCQEKAIYDAYPDAAQARTGVKLLNRLPLHMAAANPASKHSLISTLIGVNPRATSLADKRGKLPLHLACESGLSWKSINAIHASFSAAIRTPEQNSRRWTALQIAAACTNSDNEVMSNLSKLHPEAATYSDADGYSAFHLACLAGKSWEDGLESLFEANPDAVRNPDNNGLVPFHIMCFRYSTASSLNPASRPNPVSPENRGFSKASSFDLDAEKVALKHRANTKRIENLFHLLKADPTVLNSY